VQLDPKYADEYVNWGAALRAKGNYNDEIIKYRNAIELAPHETTYHDDLARVLDAKGDKIGATAERATPEELRQQKGVLTRTRFEQVILIVRHGLFVILIESGVNPIGPGRFQAQDYTTCRVCCSSNCTDGT
jgi:hypothetical protein